MNWREATVERGQPVSEHTFVRDPLDDANLVCSRCGVKLPGAIYESPKEVQRQIDTGLLPPVSGVVDGPFLEHIGIPAECSR